MNPLTQLVNAFARGIGYALARLFMGLFRRGQ